MVFLFGPAKISNVQKDYKKKGNNYWNKIFPNNQWRIGKYLYYTSLYLHVQFAFLCFWQISMTFCDMSCTSQHPPNQYEASTISLGGMRNRQDESKACLFTFFPG